MSDVVQEQNRVVARLARCRGCNVDPFLFAMPHSDKFLSGEGDRRLYYGCEMHQNLTKSRFKGLSVSWEIAIIAQVKPFVGETS